MTRTYGLLGLSLILALSGCAADVGSAGAGLGEMCEPSRTTPLSLTSGLGDVGDTTITTDDTAVTVTVNAASGWELGDLYVGVGPDAGSLTWYAVNPEFWITGWHGSLTAVAPLSEIGVGCGQEYKVIVQAYVRPVGTTDRQLASALGTGSLGEWGWYEIDTICCPPADAGCTLTQGYWKNHEDAWPVASLSLGGETYDAAQLDALLETPVRRDASLSLAHQLIAAELNAASGATADPAIADAQAWLAAQGGRLPLGVHASSAAGAEAVAIAERLASYNEGLTGPGHCD